MCAVPPSSRYIFHYASPYTDVTMFEAEAHGLKVCRDRVLEGAFRCAMVTVVVKRVYGRLSPYRQGQIDTIEARIDKKEAMLERY